MQQPIAVVHPLGWGTVHDDRKHEADQLEYWDCCEVDENGPLAHHSVTLFVAHSIVCVGHDGDQEVEGHKSNDGSRQ